MQYDPLDEDSDMGHRLYNVCNRLSSQRILQAVRQRLLFTSFYWRRVSERFLGITAKLDIGLGCWIQRVKALSSSDVQLLIQWRDSVIQYVDTILAARGEEATQYEQPVDDASDSGSDAGGSEPLSELDPRAALREETSRLMHVLGCSNLCGDYYYDYVGIEWLHLGRWGQDHPSEDIGSPVWMIP
ncbi:hypothetical protein PV325_013825, partial [Microctonus aethiopoides]